MAGSSTVLRYPYEAITDTTDYLQIAITKYVAAPEGSEGLLSTGQFNPSTNPVNASNVAANSLKPQQLGENGIIILPMPSNIEDSNSVSYDGDTLNGLTETAIVATKTAMGINVFDTSTVKSKLNAIGTLIGTKLEDAGVKDIVMNALAAQAVNVFGSNVTPNQLLARTQGRILNPNMELLFSNVTLRTFRFSFKMTPRDEVESMQVKSIIRTFKKNMAAKGGTGGLLLSTPNVFELRYRKGNKDHPFLHRFKQCALSDMSVNYTGENVYATYSDGTPVSIIMNLTFKELVPIYDSDYDTNSNGDEFSDGSLKYGISGQRPNAQQVDVEGVGF